VGAGGRWAVADPGSVQPGVGGGGAGDAEGGRDSGGGAAGGAVLWRPRSRAQNHDGRGGTSAQIWAARGIASGVMADPQRSFRPVEPPYGDQSVAAEELAAHVVVRDPRDDDRVAVLQPSLEPQVAACSDWPAGRRSGWRRRRAGRRRAARSGSWGERAIRGEPVLVERRLEALPGLALFVPAGSVDVPR